MPRWRWARLATRARSRRWRRCSDRSARHGQPSIAAAICLLGVQLRSHENVPDRDAEVRRQQRRFQELLRGAAAGLGALAVAGRHVGGRGAASSSASRRAIRPARPWPWRSRRSRLRNTPLMLSVLESAAAARPRSSCWPKASTCSRRTSTRSGSSPLVRRDLLGRADGSPTRADADAHREAGF